MKRKHIIRELLGLLLQVSSSIGRGACVRPGPWVLVPLAPLLWMCGRVRFGAGADAGCRCQMCGHVRFGAGPMQGAAARCVAACFWCWCRRRVPLPGAWAHGQLSPQHTTRPVHQYAQHLSAECHALPSTARSARTSQSCPVDTMIMAAQHVLIHNL